MLNPAEHDHWLRIARRYTRPGIDAADVLQEACLAAMKAQRTDLSTEPNQRYFRGIIRKTAWAMMRADTRRKRHEQSQTPVELQATSEAAPPPDLSILPPSLQAVANLVMANLDRNEIRSALCITDDALRRRLADLRRYVEKHSIGFEAFKAAVHAQAKVSPEDVGLIRQALTRWLTSSQSMGQAIGTVDPDGHLIAISEKSQKPLTKPDRPATQG